jgi:hypothetical protein
VSTFGVLAAVAGIEHGVGEILHGPVRPESLVIESWAGSEAFEILGGEPALTVVPNLAVTGILAIVAAIALGIWSVGFAHRRHGGLVLILLSVLLLLVGGGFGPPLVGIIVGVAAARIGVAGHARPGRAAGALGRAWPWLLGAGVLGYLSLVPGAIVLDQLIQADITWLVAALPIFSIAFLVLALVAARARDRTRPEPRADPRGRAEVAIDEGSERTEGEDGPRVS